MPIEEKGLDGMFSEIAPYYDLLNHVLSFYGDTFWRRRFVDGAKIGENAKILNIID